MKFILTLLAIAATFRSVTAQDGSLDLSFNTDGMLTTSIGTEDYGRAVAVQPDGKILVAGYSYDGDRDQCAVVRYLADGSLDNSFDFDGIALTSIGDSGNRGHALAIQNDGKIVVAGYAYNGIDNDFAVVRYNTDGSTDNTFDNDGIATAGFIEFSNDRAFAVALQPDGKIVLGGYYSAGSMNRDFAMIRFNPDGVLDPSFGGGSITSAIDVGDDEIQSLLVQDDGKIVAGGYSFNFATRVFVIARYNPDGSPDSDFGNAGVATTTFTENDDAAYALAQQPDGKYILAGYTHGDTYDFALARYNTDGSPDITFGVDGKVVTPIGDANEEARALTIQSDGNILVAGFSYDYWEYFAIARYNPDGSLDSSFGTDGKVITNIDGEGNYDWIHSIALQSDGKILVAGRSETEDEGSVFAVARYHNLGSVAISAWPGAPVAISAYPMPCHDELFFNPVPAHFAVTMYNVQGQMISGLITTSTGIKLPPDLPAGIYNLHIRSGEHEARLSICKE